MAARVPMKNPGKTRKAASSIAGGSSTPGFMRHDGAGSRGTGRPRVAVKGSDMSAKSLAAHRNQAGPVRGTTTQGAKAGTPGSAPSLSMGGGKSPGLKPVVGGGNSSGVGVKG